LLAAKTRFGKIVLASRAGAFIASRLAAGFLRLIGSTWRIQVDGPDPFSAGPGPHLGAFWHRNALIAAYAFRDKGFSVPVSRSRDGDLITRLLLELGYKMPPRGSSSQGGTVALRALDRMVEAGTTISIQTDGPRGPARVSKLGMVSLARRTGRPISPLAFSAKPCIRFNSWDSTLLPLPFARVLCSFGAPIAVPRDAEPGEEEEIRAALDLELNRLTDLADARCGLPTSQAPSA